MILDWVPNHSSSQHPWFVDAITSPQAAHHDWYVWSATSGGANWHAADGAFYYAAFVAEMPDLNWRNAAVSTEIAAAATRWIARGVDGFRLDAVQYLVENGSMTTNQPETHAALKGFAAAVRAAKPDALLFGEAWTDTGHIAPYFGTIDATSAASGGDELLPSTSRSRAPSSEASKMEARAIWPAPSTPWRRPIRPEQATRRSSPTTTRCAWRPTSTTTLLSSSSRRRSCSPLQGTPIIYYGEELGMQNGAGSDDQLKRMPMAWDGSPTRGFTTGTPWFQFAPGSAPRQRGGGDRRSLFAPLALPDAHPHPQGPRARSSAAGRRAWRPPATR